MSEPFCSRLAEAAHGVVAGTGVRGDVYVFLPVDKKRWGRREFNEGWATSEELEAIRRARRLGVIVRLYNPPDASGKAAILAHRAPEPSAQAADALQGLLADLRRHAWGLDESNAPRLALCTQGTRDRCCAKWGFAVYRAARDLYDVGQFPFAPIECSHLGGDRFAATGIAFPSGGMYGHLDRLPLAALAAAEADGRILQEHYRGRVFETALAQVVRAGLARDGFDVTTVSPVTLDGPQAGAGPLRVTASGRSYEVTLSPKAFHFFGDCRAAAQGRMSHDTRLAYDRAQPVGDLPSLTP
ncbi:sucrase ferredoxin [Phenylobacterium sp.]|uniref:sucrase ferredoxin n=1 Tax=Phenylobacterium sp. TaxID=1871053 RepID=UPI0025CEB1B1|nr:sucrase ferredoxin [Phenylobacterium sp.]